MRPILGIARSSTAGSSESMKNSVMPSVGLAPSARAAVRVASMIFWDSSALVHQILRPLMTYSSPSRFADVVIRAVSVPASGSVSPNATCRPPSAARGRMSRRISSVACLVTMLKTKNEPCSALQPFMAAPEAAISSTISDASVMPRPLPPYSSGMLMPSQPPFAKAS